MAGLLGRRWRYRSYCDTYVFVLRGDLQHEEAPRVLSAQRTESVIAGGRSYCSNEQVIEAMYCGLRRGHSPGFSSPIEAALPEVLQAVRAGSLVAFKEEVRLPPQYGEEEPIPEPAPAEEPVPGTFDLQVVLDCDGSGVGQLSLGVKTRGESEFRSQRTDGEGCIHIEYVARGTADVCTDIKNARLDQSAVVVGWGAQPIGAGSAPEADDSPPIRFLCELEEYRVGDGDTVATIARRARRSWPDLAFFNWGTRMPEEINRHLASKVGCSKRGPDGSSFIFSSDDWPGIIRFPKPFTKGGLPTDEENILRVKHAQSSVASWVKVSSYYDDAWNTPWPLEDLQLDCGGATVDDGLSVDHARQGK